MMSTKQTNSRALRNLLGALGAALAFSVIFTLPACNTEVDPADMAQASAPRVRTYFNQTGTRQLNGIEHQTDDMTVQMIDRATSTIDFAIMGFSRTEIIDALLRAHYRGVRLRFVGDGRHQEHHVAGYEAIDRLNIPMISGNQFHIMHNKFFIIDDRFVITGTGNITPTGYNRNNNNYVFIDSPQIAADFKAEFEQMFAGRFGSTKDIIDNGTYYKVGDTDVEVFFSPQEDPVARILQYLGEAKESIHFMIFAFTKDQIGSAFINKHLEFARYNRCCDPARAGDLSSDDAATCAMQVVCEEPFRPKEVRGMIDRSQLHSNGPYHEVYRMLLFGLDMRQDGNDNSRQPGDYQAGGGRLHSKTMVIDHDLPEHAKVLTGSFNWSASATSANDETFLVLHGTRVAKDTFEFFESHWDNGKRFGNNYIGDSDNIQKGDIVFNEIHWDGWNGQNDPSDFGGDDVYNDEFIELLNTTDQPIDLTMWTIGTADDFVVGLYPGTIIGPHERFLIVDHNLAPFTDLAPQDVEGSAFDDPDFVMNTANDPRFLRLNLHNAKFSLRLLDPRGNVMDVAGDNGPPFAGGRRVEGGSMLNYSMERVHPVIDGSKAEAWQECTADQGGIHIREEFRNSIRATPGEANSTKAFPEPEPTGFRNPAGNR